MTMDAGWAWVFGGLIIAGLVLLGIVLARVVRGGITPGSPPGSPPGTAPGGPSAVEELAQRYARGEIETAEYEERLRHLRGG
jgi:putative membrane protein